MRISQILGCFYLPVQWQIQLQELVFLSNYYVQNVAYVENINLATVILCHTIHSCTLLTLLQNHEFPFVLADFVYMCFVFLFSLQSVVNTKKKKTAANKTMKILHKKNWILIFKTF